MNKFLEDLNRYVDEQIEWSNSCMDDVDMDLELYPGNLFYLYDFEWLTGYRAAMLNVKGMLK